MNNTTTTTNDKKVIAFIIGAVVLGLGTLLVLASIWGLPASN
jgi:uncharacterized membrane protein